MSSRLSKSDKILQDRLQALLSHLLREEDNKYCADCDAKGPRWASWNLGIFVCIRCAGIHRNLGVHISRVKSVNLDSWTDEQVGSMQNMGNSKGRAVYEANLPDGFRRPQNDSALETFIRAKYEHKKYIAREWVPPTGPQKADLSVLGVSNSGTTRSSSERKLDLSTAASSVPRPNSMGNLKDGLASPTVPAVQKSQQQQQQPTAPTSPSDDLFADFISAPLPATTTAPASANRTSLSPDSEEKDFFNQVSSAPAAPAKGACANGTANTKIDTASIMSLYAKSPPVQSPLLQHQAGLNMSLVGSLNGLTPQMVANNPFLMGSGVIAPQPQVGLPTGFAQPGQLTGLNHLAGYGGVPAAAAQTAFMGASSNFASPTGVASLGGAMPPQIVGSGVISPNCISGTPMANLSLVNSQMAGLQLGPTAQKIPVAAGQFKTTATANGSVLTPNFN